MPVPNDMRPSSSAGDLFRSLERGIHHIGGCTPNQPRLVNYEADDSSHFPVCAVPCLPFFRFVLSLGHLASLVSWSANSQWQHR